MKVAVLILAVAVVGAFAQEATTGGIPPFKCTSSNAFVCTFQELGHKIKYHAKKLGGKLAEVGTSIGKSVLDQGKDLLANGAQAVLGTVLDHLNKEGIVGKRAIFADKVKEHLKNGYAKLKQWKEGIHNAYKNALSKLTTKITDNSALKDIDENTDKKIDEVVAKFGKDSKKGFFGMAKTISGKIAEIFKAGLEALKAKYAKGKDVETRAIFGFDSLKDAFGKVKEHLSKATSSIAGTFAPHWESLKSGVAALGAKAKEHAGNLVESAKKSFADLKTKLSGHIDTLKGHASKLGDHAKNALAALKEAISSIATQALSNAKDTIGDAVKTGTDAAGVVAGHVSGAIGGF